MFDMSKIGEAMQSANVIANQMQDMTSRLEAIENLTREQNALIATQMLDSGTEYSDEMKERLVAIATRGPRGA